MMSLARMPYRLNGFIFRLAKRRPLRAVEQSEVPPDRWRSDEVDGVWNIALVPTWAYQAEIAAAVIFFPAMVFGWLYANVPAGHGSVLQFEDEFLLLLAGLLPLLVWIVGVWLVQRFEVLPELWDSAPKSMQSDVELMLKLPVADLPYSWCRGSKEELFLRLAMKRYFQLSHVTIRGIDYDVYFPSSLVVWFAAPAYLSLISIFSLAVTLSVSLPIDDHLRPSAYGFFGILTAVWAAFFFFYLYWMQVKRVYTQLDAHPEEFDSALIPGAFDVPVPGPPNIRSKTFLAAIPSVLGLIMLLLFPVLESLLSKT